MRKLSQKEVQSRIDDAHGKGAFILQEEYKNRRTKILTTHIECGYKWKADTYSLMSGHGCPKCSKNQKKTQKEFENEIFDLVKNEYTVISEYINTHEKVCFRHNECGETFEMEANAFLRGQRCPHERYKKSAKSNTTLLSEAQKMMYESTNGEYEILEGYKGLHPRKGGKTTILHKTCGHTFKVQPGRIINTESGCPKCSESHGEKFVNEFLVENGFDFKREYRIKECRNIRPLPFDFAMFDNKELKCLIEYDGEQHFKPKFGKEHFKKTKHNDEIKNEFCKKNNIDLIRIPYKRSYTSKSAKEYVYEYLSDMLIPSQA